ncbi:MAG: hypothetical protein JOZ54_03380 [Acidobacteria bacterium]|nr:hypothetical protein [Acidobacteriota bacterium]
MRTLQFWLAVAGLLVTGYWLLVAGCWLLVAGYWLLALLRLNEPMRK